MGYVFLKILIKGLINGSKRFQTVPNGSKRFQTVPNGSKRFQTVPNGSKRFQTVPPLAFNIKNTLHGSSDHKNLLPHSAPTLFIL